MATPEQPSEPTNHTKLPSGALRHGARRCLSVGNHAATSLLSLPKHLMRFLLQTDRPLANRLLPPIGVLSILALTWGSIGIPTGKALKHFWPLAVFTACGIIFAYFLYRTSRERQNAIFENIFGWLPVFLGALSYGYWYWYAGQQEFFPEKEFFLASAEVLPLLLLAAVVDVRRTERLQSKQLVLPVIAVFLGELTALNALAFGTSGPASFAAVASSFVSSTVALVLAVMANISASGSHEPEVVKEESSHQAPEILNAEDQPSQQTDDQSSMSAVKVPSLRPADSGAGSTTRDPYKGVIRWSSHRAREHFASILSSAVAIPAIAAIVAAFVGLPPKPKPGDQIENALIGLGSGIVFVALVAALYAFLRAPYEQRAMLRGQLSGQRAEIQELESSVRETLEISSLVITRNIPDLSRPLEYDHLQFTLTFSNTSDVAIKYSLQSAVVDLPGILPIGALAHDRYRIGVGKTHQYIIYTNFNPMQSGRAVGILDYRVWYGPTSNPDMCEQHRRIQFTSTPDVNPSTSSTSHVFLSGGTDEARYPAASL